MSTVIMQYTAPFIKLQIAP